MQFIKILLWVLLLVGSFIFWWSNEARTTLDLGAAVVEARVSTFVLFAFLVGFLPTWLLSRGTKWRLTRRIKTLEEAARPTPTPTPDPLDLSKEDIKKSEEKPAAVKPVIEAENDTNKKEEGAKS